MLSNQFSKKLKLLEFVPTIYVKIKASNKHSCKNITLEFFIKREQWKLDTNNSSQGIYGQWYQTLFYL